ncbi:MAG: flagellar brake domain-containing protein [Nitrospirae bacterium]|nr:flagellar brake domain-containing protein [Nitrospirota bacterium]
MATIDLDIGSQLIIEIKTGLNRIKSSFIGMESGEYIIIKIHKSHNLQNLHSLLYKGHPITVRYVDKGKVYGFITSVFYITYNPDKLIFLSFPDKIEEQNVRSHKRVVCSFASKISFYDVEFKGIVVDISKNGCRFNTVVDESANKETIGKNLNDFILRCSLSPEKINLSLKLPGSKHNINIACKQRSMNKDNNIATLGLEFISMTEEDSIIFYDYLLDLDALPMEFNIHLAVIKHTVWMNRFMMFIYGSKDISKKEFISAKESDLGKWLYSEGFQMYRHIKEMQQLETVHEDLHKFIFDIVKETPEKYNKEQIDSLIKRIDEMSQRIIILLNTTEKHLIAA